ncbi:amidohydrolase family protein [Sporichthya polymorpha]|uniref:amidohydrolase family protein n=1 Tax=Sporichthya polymorpha TaxID=35751 RepID=UPI00036FECAE|nr:amidohydrolase family protein [Sporichthya polymorpha]
MRIDVHTHVVPPDLPDFATSLGDPRWPVFRLEGSTGRLWKDGAEVRAVPEAAWSVDRRLDHMDKVGVDVQVLSPLPPLTVDWADESYGFAFCAQVNYGIAEMVQRAPSRLAGLGMVPLQDCERAICALEDAHGLGLKGVQIGTQGGTRELDDPQIRDFFARAAELGMTILVHPLILGASVPWTTRISGLPLTFGLGMTTDTAIAAAALVLGGVTAELPDLRICLAHGGGTFVWALPRIAHAWAMTNDVPLAQQMRNVYVDTVVYDRANLDHLIRVLGPDRVIWGTDYPLPAAAEQTGELLAGLPDEHAAAVSGGNAARLLGLSP